MAVLMLSGFPCPTADVYRAFDRLPAPTDRQIDPELFSDKPPSQWRGLLKNNLQPAAEASRLCSATQGEVFEKAAGLPVCMSGSGSSLFVLCDDAAEAAGAMSRLPEEASGGCVLLRQRIHGDAYMHITAGETPAARMGGTPMPRTGRMPVPRFTSAPAA